MEQITIAGATYNVPLRYEEGHELTAGEASALNQTFHENIRNNLAKQQKDGTLTQEIVDKYAAEYAFGVRSGGGVSRDPVMSEAMRMAKAKLSEALKAAGRKPSEVDSAAFTAAAKALIERDPTIIETAKENVARRQAIATGDLGDLLSTLTAKPAEG